MENKPDILLFMSDQHNGLFLECLNEFVEAPNLRQLSMAGVTFNNTYCSSPICVPSRVSMLTGQLPSKTLVLTNSGYLPSDQATFAHALAAEGYETVLVGRMHFLGMDQFHGFTKRMVGDFTPNFLGRYGDARTDLGPYVNTPSFDFAKVYGGGNSPVLEYDKAVVQSALEYIRQPHKKPQFILVGTYGPHHTFVAPPDLYKKYLDKLKNKSMIENVDSDLHPIVKTKVKNIDPKVSICLQAAYLGMIEQTDRLVGEIKNAWDDRLQNQNKKGVFCYLSDHGEMAGLKKLWGKNCFYEDATRVPMIFSGNGIVKNKTVNSLTSLMDIGPTLCEIAGVEAPPDQDGISLFKNLKGADVNSERVISCEYVIDEIPGKMVRFENWKYISYGNLFHENQLFDLNCDPEENTNCIKIHPEIAKKLNDMLELGWRPQEIINVLKTKKKHLKLISKWDANVEVLEPFRWQVPESSWVLPVP